MFRFKMVVVVLGVVAAVAAPIRAYGGNVEIAEQIRDQIRTYIKENDIHGFLIHVRVKDGTATLRGHLKSQEQVAAAVRIA